MKISDDPINGGDAWTGGKGKANGFIIYARKFNVENTNVFLVLGKTGAGTPSTQTFYVQEPSITKVPHKVSGSLYKITLDANDKKNKQEDVSNNEDYKN